MYVGYVRVSHVGTRSGERFHSPSDQESEIRGWAKRAGVEVEVLEPELDESGARRDRPILERAVAGVESGRWEGLVVAYLSRFARSVVHLLEVEERIEAAGGRVVYARENLDTSTPQGRLHRTMLAAFAEMERDQKVEDFARVTENAIDRGLWKFRQVPLGYELAGERPARLVPSADAPKVLRAFQMRAGGTSISEIASDLVMTTRGTRHLLANRVYLGEVRAGDFVNRAAHDPIIPVDLFDRVQSMRGVRPPAGGAATLLAGVIRCQSCGHVMRTGKGGGGHRVYACHGRHSLGKCPAPATITQRRIDPYVESLARAEIAALTVTASRKSGTLDALRAEVHRAESEVAAYLAATEAAGLPLDVFVEGARSRQREVEKARAKLEQAQAVTPLGARFSSGADAWDALGVQDRNLVLRGLLDAVVVRPAGKGSSPPVRERARVFVKGSIDLPTRHGHTPLPIVALPFPDADDPRLLGVAFGEDRLKGKRG